MIVRNRNCLILNVDDRSDNYFFCEDDVLGKYNIVVSINFESMLILHVDNIGQHHMSQPVN